VDILSLLAVIGYMVTIFSIGYTLGKDFSRKSR